jgi:hypothetical protein
MDRLSALVASTTADPGTLGGSSLASWWPLVTLLAAFAVAVALLAIAGRPDPAWGPLRQLARVPRGLTRVTGVPGWAAVAVGLSLFGLMVAGEGFYSDVSWHVALGRDDELFTAPHTSILVGLVAILGAAVLGTVVATLDGVPGFRVAGLRVPPTLVPLWAVGLAAVSGFPLDEIWHEAYGIDVTMWSPTHMLMILGASLTGLAAWVALAGAGVRAQGGGRWGRGLHLVCGWLTLEGLVASQGEFAFGVPQFSHLFHPVLVSLAAGLALVAIRLVHGRWWTLGVASLSFLLFAVVLDGETSSVATRSGGTYVVSALVVEAVAAVLGTGRRLRFAVVSGLGVGTIGLAAEWLWNQGAAQPWSSALLPEAVVLAAVAAMGAAVLGAVVGGAIAGDRRAPMPAAAVVVAGLALVTIVALPLPRRVGDVRADIRVVEVDRNPGWADVEVTLTPADAAADAYWFQAVAWQGGGLVVADMEPTGEPGTYRSAEPVPITGHWKSLVRLHRGGELMAVPVWFPADPTIGEEEIPAEDRAVDFAAERRYLMREASAETGGALSPIVHGLLAGAVALWAAAFAVAVRGLWSAAAGGRDRDEPEAAPTSGPAAPARPASPAART